MTKYNPFQSQPLDSKETIMGTQPAPQQQAPRQAPQQTQHPMFGSPGGDNPNKVVHTNILGAWVAEQNGFEPGKKTIEYELVENVTARGGKFRQLEFFTRGKVNDKTGKPWRWHQYAESQLPQLIDRINHYFMNYAQQKGYYQWVPAQEQASQPTAATATSTSTIPGFQATGQTFIPRS